MLLKFEILLYAKELNGGSLWRWQARIIHSLSWQRRGNLANLRDRLWHRRLSVVNNSNEIEIKLKSNFNEIKEKQFIPILNISLFSMNTSASISIPWFMHWQWRSPRANQSWIRNPEIGISNDCSCSWSTKLKVNWKMKWIYNSLALISQLVFHSNNKRSITFSKIFTLSKSIPLSKTFTLSKSIPLSKTFTLEWFANLVSTKKIIQIGPWWAKLLAGGCLGIS